MEKRNLQEYKGYNLGLMSSHPLVSIKAKGQGKVPATLSGMYTSMGSATQAIDSYLNSLKKGTSNGKTSKSTSTG